MYKSYQDFINNEDEWLDIAADLQDNPDFSKLLKDCFLSNKKGFDLDLLLQEMICKAMLDRLQCLHELGGITDEAYEDCINMGCY